MVLEAGNRRSWVALGALALLVGAKSAACDPPFTEPPPGVGGELRAQLLADFGAEVVLPTLEGFVASAGQLHAGVQGWRAAAQAGDGTVDRQRAQNDWRLAMSDWQGAEQLQIGPAGSSLQAVRGAQDLRDAIYSWPTVNPCGIDQALVDGSFADAGFVAGALPGLYGLDALEYLLFDVDDAHDCPSPIGLDAGWDALGDTVEQQRAAYAEVVAADLLSQAEALLDAWSEDGGNFAFELATAGGESTVYATDQQAFDAIFRAIFYLELVVKDRKLARPLGLRDCLDLTCPEDLESQHARASLQHIAANLQGFRRAWTAESGVGFDDILAAIDEAELSSQLLAALNAADATAASISPPLVDVLAADPDAVLALHDAIKVIADLLKGDLATVLTLTVPSEAAGDND